MALQQSKHQLYPMKSVSRRFFCALQWWCCLPGVATKNFTDAQRDRRPVTNSGSERMPEPDWKDCNMCQADHIVRIPSYGRFPTTGSLQEGVKAKSKRVVNPSM
jgi:hypothetical protein